MIVCYPADYGAEDGIAAIEVPEDGRLGNAHPPGDGLGGEALDPLLGGQRKSRFDNFLPADVV
jgi:hypothetical protein